MWMLFIVYTKYCVVLLQLFRFYFKCPRPKQFCFEWKMAPKKKSTLLRLLSNFWKQIETISASRAVVMDKSTGSVNYYFFFLANWFCASTRTNVKYRFKTIFIIMLNWPRDGAKTLPSGILQRFMASTGEIVQWDYLRSFQAKLRDNLPRYTINCR